MKSARALEVVFRGRLGFFLAACSKVFRKASSSFMKEQVSRLAKSAVVQYVTVFRLILAKRVKHDLGLETERRHIRAEHDKAIYVHCMNHRLNLCVADTCQLPLVRNMMDVVRKISEFFDNSPKRQQHLISNACGQPLCCGKCVSNKVD